MWAKDKGDSVASDNVVVEIRTDSDCERIDQLGARVEPSRGMPDINDPGACCNVFVLLQLLDVNAEFIDGRIRALIFACRRESAKLRFLGQWKN